VNAGGIQNNLAKHLFSYLFGARGYLCKKNMYKIIILLSMAIVFMACGGSDNGKNANGTTKNEASAIKAINQTAVDTLIAQYMNLKDAFVHDSLPEVKLVTTAFIAASMPTESQLKGVAMKSPTMFMNVCKGLNAQLQQLDAATGLEGKRLVFKELLPAMRKIIATQSSVSVYEQHCPMAYNDSGANWLSYNTEIRNPYLPRTMLKCGLVQDTLKFVQ
jgi:hypothetical protein